MKNDRFDLLGQFSNRIKTLFYCIRTVFILCAFTTLAGCQTTGPIMSIEKARDVVISMNQIPLDPPPRRIDDVFAKLGNNEVDPLQTNTLSEWNDWNIIPPGHSSKPEVRASLTSRQAFKLSKMELAAGHHKSAIELAKLAIEKTVDQASKADIVYLSYLSVIYMNMGDFKSARSYLNKAQKIYDKTPRGYKVAVPQLQVAILNAEAKLLEAQGKFSTAHEARCIALNVWNQKGSIRLSIRARIRVALNLKAQGRTTEAEMAARQAFQEAFIRFGRNSEITATAVNALGEIMLAQGRPAEALKLARAQVSIMNRAAAAEPRGGMIKSRIFAGDVLCAGYSFREAMVQYDQVISAAKDNPYFFKSRILQNTGLILSLIKTGRAGEALELIAASVSIFNQIDVPGHYGTAEMVALRGMARALSNEKELAFKDLSQALRIILDSGGNRSNDYSKNRRLSIIVEAYLELLADIRGNGWEPKFGIDAAAESFEIAAAIRDSKVQFALSESAVRAAAISDPALMEFVRREQDANKQINALQATLANTLATPAHQQDADSIQNVRDSITDLIQARAALVDQIKKEFPRYTEFSNLQAVSLAAIQRHLTPDEALLSIWTALNKTYVWAIPHRGKVAFRAVPLGYAVLKQRVEILRRALEPQTVTYGDIPEFDIEQAYRLYSELLLPVEKGWRNARELLVVVQGPLGQLPLAVLPTSPAKYPATDVELFSQYRKVPWLIRDLSITRLPSAASLAMLRSLSAGDPGRRAFLGFGDPVFNAAQLPDAGSEQIILEPVQRSGRVSIRGIRLTEKGDLDSDKILSTQLDHLARLPDTAEEIKSIGGILAADPDQDIYLGARATEYQIKSMNLANHKVIAFATHALVPGDLDGLTQPALAFCAPSVTDDYEDGLLTMGEILMLNLNADWVVLSACNTGAADGAGAEAVSGLGRSFFYAGTRALLVSMWPVETTSARMLTTRLFQFQMDDNTLTRSGALRKSMLSLIDDETLKDQTTGRIVASYAHPLFWAPFVVIGESRSD